MNLVGFTYAEHNPDSWEGWQWGGAHMWGFAHRLGIPEQYDLLEDALKHSEMMVFWSADPETTGGVYAAFESTSRRFWLKELGVKMVFIDPYHNHTAGPFGDKWLAPRPGTDVALGLAIAHTWLAEGTYDKEYVPSARTGFDEWKGYVLGKSDDVPKTPEWADGECGVPARQIRALAREWGAKKTMLASGGMGGWGGACRASSGNEWARMMIALAAMQGMGKPGTNIWSTTSGVPFDTLVLLPRLRRGRDLGRHRQHGRREEAGEPHVARRRHVLQPAALARGPDGAAPAHPRGHEARAPRVARQGLLRLVHRVAVPRVPLPRRRLSPRARCTTATAARSSAR